MENKNFFVFKAPFNQKYILINCLFIIWKPYCLFTECGHLCLGYWLPVGNFHMFVYLLSTESKNLHVTRAINWNKLIGSLLFEHSIKLQYSTKLHSAFQLQLLENNRKLLNNYGPLNQSIT